MLRTALALVLGLSGVVSAQVPRSEMIAEIKDFSRTVGFEETNNFRHGSNAISAFYRCYYTEKLTLPDSYDGLRLTEGSQTGCKVDESKFDIFFYPIEAVANGNAPVTSSLAETSVERLAVVVAHEDFHEHKQVQKLPPAVGEAAATLIGFLTAAEFARERFGAESREHRNLLKEADLFLQKAKIVNRYHEAIRRLYASARSGEISKQDALARKGVLFARLAGECEAIKPEPASFNRCPAVLNNAGLAFDMTYTRHYPFVYEIFLAQGKDLSRTIEAIKGFPAGSDKVKTQ